MRACAGSRGYRRRCGSPQIKLAADDAEPADFRRLGRRSTDVSAVGADGQRIGKHKPPCDRSSGLCFSIFCPSAARARPAEGRPDSAYQSQRNSGLNQRPSALDPRNRRPRFRDDPQPQRNPRPALSSPRSNKQRHEAREEREHPRCEVDAVPWRARRGVGPDA